MGIEKFLISFGFAKDSMIVAIVCLLVLLGNFTGGLMSNILLAQGGPIPKRKFTEKTSFRLALVSELMLLVYAAYYHVAVTQDIITAQIIYWAFTLLAAPLLAALGAQLSYIAFSKKLDKLRADHRNKHADKNVKESGR
jgi:hypothetical protein